MSLYATLADVQDLSAGNDTSATAAAKNAILRALRDASRRVDREFAAKRPLFAPYTETRRFALSSQLVGRLDNTLKLPGPLLELTAVTVGDTTLTVNTSVFAWPDPNTPPFTALRLYDSYRSWYGYAPAAEGAPLEVTVTGVWGLHRDYTNAWQEVDALGATINDNVTTLTVADVDGPDAYGITPRISAGSLLKAGSEVLEVTATDTAANTATVRRGVNGTTAAAHNEDDAVYVWQVEESIRRAVARQAALMYARRGAYTTVEVSGMSEVRYPADLLTELRAVLQDYAYGA